MASTARTLLRGFLLVGGLALAGVGLVDGSTVDVAVGALATVVGAIGLWFAFRDEGGGDE